MDEIAQSIVLRKDASGDQNWRPSLIAVYQFAPDAPEPGLPGKEPGDLLLLSSTEETKTLLVSLGKPDKFALRPLEMVRQASGKLGKWLSGSGASELYIEMDTLQAAAPGQAQVDLAEAALVGLSLGGYHFHQYKHNDGQVTIPVVGLLSGGEPLIDPKLVARVIAITHAVVLARDLAHEPANVINPVTLAERAQEVADRSGLKITVLDERQLAEMGAGAILAVGQGSKTPPRMIILEYAGQGAAPELKPVVLVGKAITFDTGGYSIKNTRRIVGMKYDKCGGVDVLATMQAAAALKVDDSHWWELSARRKI